MNVASLMSCKLWLNLDRCRTKSADSRHASNANVCQLTDRG